MSTETTRYAVYVNDEGRTRYVSSRKCRRVDGGVLIETGLTDAMEEAMEFDLHQARFMCSEYRKFKYAKSKKP